TKVKNDVRGKVNTTPFRRLPVTNDACHAAVWLMTNIKRDFERKYPQCRDKLIVSWDSHFEKLYKL
ncbi:hypothetical protein DBV15_10435, partial [Temnothorax longispinosus]